MKILILGANGQIGSSLVKVLQKDYQITKLTRNNLNCEDLYEVQQYFVQKHFDLIINAVAYTKVDQAEDKPKTAMKLNYQLPKILAKIAKKMNSALIHYSTDYVFDGYMAKDYFEESIPKPLNVYEKTKLKGDLAILKEQIKGYILRVSWVYGNKDHSFLHKIQKQINQKKPLTVVRDQVGTPTSSTFIANITKKLIDQKKFKTTKIYNLSPKGKCSWYDFTKAYLQQKKITHSLSTILTEDIQQKAKRPKTVKLNTSRLEQLLQTSFPSWKKILKDYVHER